jgi:hypothetical protein
MVKLSFLFRTASTVLLIAGIGVTAGAHRLWCHRSYKAKWPLRLLLCIFQTAAFQVQYISSGSQINSVKQYLFTVLLMKNTVQLIFSGLSSNVLCNISLI